MRFLGNKSSLFNEIENFIMDNISKQGNMVFFDAFCGTGAVSDGFKQKFDIIINDNLKWATVYSAGRILGSQCTFENLGVNPFDYFEKHTIQIPGFMYKNYSPSITKRMYFTPDNAAKIDFYRKKIETWHIKKRITNNEYLYLLACLIESVSKISNTAGVYGAFLKTWDNRALKPIEFIPVDNTDTYCKSLKVYNEKIENIISDVDCDILYLDPPYTQNQYGTQYHLLETLILNDQPPVSKVTGSRPVTPMRSDWSKEYKAHILLDYVLAHTKAKYVVMSYNNKGVMSREYITASMKRYGVEFMCKKIGYKKYKNWKSKDNKEHYEYLFFIKKKDAVIYQSPLNYIGNKTRVIDDIRMNLPHNIYNFIDAFGGGFNVGINIESSYVLYNELNNFVYDIIVSLRRYDTYQYIKYIKKLEKHYDMEKGNKEAYIKLRTYYNSKPENERDPRMLLTLILYGFQQQIRFNNNHEFNNPPGIRWFNDCLLEKMVSFSRRIKEINCNFKYGSYEYLDKFVDDGKSFFYFDPPYMLTIGSYNDGKRGFQGWNKKLENDLFNFIDNLTKRNVKFMLSYVLIHNNEKNCELVSWIERNNYNVIALGNILGISGSRRKEVLITNYVL